MEKINTCIKITNKISSCFRGPPHACKLLVLDSENVKKQPDGIVKKCQLSNCCQDMSSCQSCQLLSRCQNMMSKIVEILKMKMKSQIKVNEAGILMSESSKLIHLHYWFHWFHKFLKLIKIKCTFLVFLRVLINTSLLRCLRLVFCTRCTEWTSTLQWGLGGGRGGSGLCGMVSSTSEYNASYCVYLELVPAGAESCMIDDMSGGCEENLMKVHMINTCIDRIKPQQTSRAVWGMVSNGVPLFTYMLPMFTPMSIVHQIMLVINAYLSDKCKSMFTTYTDGSRRSTGRGIDWPEIKHNDQSSKFIHKLNKQLLIIVYVIM